MIDLSNVAATSRPDGPAPRCVNGRAAVLSGPTDSRRAARRCPSSRSYLAGFFVVFFFRVSGFFAVFAFGSASAFFFWPSFGSNRVDSSSRPMVLLIPPV